MKIVEIAPQSRDDQLIENLVELWENSVRATHVRRRQEVVQIRRQKVVQASFCGV